MTRPIHVAILGASGYGAGELLRLCTQHPAVEVVSLTSTGHAGQSLLECLQRRCRFSVQEERQLQ